MDPFPTLAQLFFAVAEPCSCLGDDLLGHCQIEYVTLVADSVRMHHIKFGDAERGRYLILDDLGLHPLADDVFTVLELAYAAHVDSAR